MVQLELHRPTSSPSHQRLGYTIMSSPLTKKHSKMEPNQYLYWLDIGQPAIVSPFSISICVEAILEVSVTARATNPIN